MRPLDAFDRLRSLLVESSSPSDIAPVRLHLGEQRLVVPALPQTLFDPVEWSKYPAPGGVPSLRLAYRSWLADTFDVMPSVGAEEPTPGSKQAIATAILLSVLRARARGVEHPCIAIPDLCYPTYRAAALAAGARAVPYASDALELSAEPLRELTAPLAAIVLCSPNNPTGSVISRAVLADALAVARKQDAILLADECYIELWQDRELASAAQLLNNENVGRVLVFHTLSKRSAAPGLRSGFVVGDPVSVEEYARFNRNCGVSSAFPVCAAAEHLWRDKTHVPQLRAALNENWRVVDQTLSSLPGYVRPRAGLFLWLAVPNAEAATRALWRQAAVMAMPGGYLSATSDGSAGNNRLRFNIACPRETLKAALIRVRGVLENMSTFQQS